MTGSKYRELRERDNRDIRLKKKEEMFLKLKKLLDKNMLMFNSTDDLFYLIDVMRVGTIILEKQKFPIKEFIKYKNG